MAALQSDWEGSCIGLSSLCCLVRVVNRLKAIGDNGWNVQWFSTAGYTAACLWGFHSDLSAQWQQDNMSHSARLLPEHPLRGHPSAIVVRDPAERLRPLFALTRS